MLPSARILLILLASLSFACAGMQWGPRKCVDARATVEPVEGPQPSTQLYEFPLRNIEWTDVEEFDSEAQSILLASAGIAGLIAITVLVVDTED